MDKNGQRNRLFIRPRIDFYKRVFEALTMPSCIKVKTCIKVYCIQVKNHLKKPNDY